MSVTAVVLAGGESRRFGSDKLSAVVDGMTLLDQALDGLPSDWLVVVVGPERLVRRPVQFVREEPPGGGPAAGMVTGLRAALTAGGEQVVVLPGDAPRAGHAATALLAVLSRSPTAQAVVATDAGGFDQPLQLALRRGAAAALVAAAGPERGQGGSARALVNRLTPPALRWSVPVAEHWDIDTPAQLTAWAQREGGAVAEVLAAVDALGPADRPVLVALDGLSRTGKSTLADAISLHHEVTLVRGDDFHSRDLAGLTSTQRQRMSPAAVADVVLDWRRLRSEALEPLHQGTAARFQPYDWVAGDGRLSRPVTLAARHLVVVEGVYSGRPELADLVDLAVHLDSDDLTRRRRLEGRAEHGRDWTDLWERGERYYFRVLRPPGSFDLQLTATG